MKVLGIDWGVKRLGLALSDDLGKMAFEYQVLDNWDNEDVIDYLRNLTALDGIEKIVVGLPKHMNGEDSDSTQDAREFGAMLENCLDIEVIFEDERMTTKMVDNILKEMNISQKEVAKRKDMVAAKYILQSYLDREK